MAITKKRKFVSADPDKCVGCAVCEYACAMTKENLFNPLKSRIRVIRLSGLINLSVTCRLCEDPPCVAACPRDALVQEAASGIIIVDEEKCNGCRWCIQACDYGAITLHPQRKVVFLCDLCKDLEKPQCVVWCPEEALDLETTETLAQKARITVVKKLFQEAMRAGKAT